MRIRLKKILGIGLVLMTIFGLTSCGSKSSITSLDSVNFEEIDYDFCGQILIDMDTKVMYYSYNKGITPIYNSDGTLRLYEE